MFKFLENRKYLACILAMAVLAIGSMIVVGVKADNDNISVNDGGVVNVYNQDGQEDMSLGGSTSADWNVGGNLAITGNSTLTGTLAVGGETNLYGLTSGDGTLASTTSTTSGGTLTEAELLANYLLDVQSNVDTSFPLTLPATSTWTTLLPNAGNHREWLIYNASTTAAVAMTITAGTGMDLIGVTANDDVIDGNEYSTLNCHRKANTDVVCRLTEEIHVD